MSKNAKERSILVPKELLKVFEIEHRLLLDERIGLWPVDARLLKSGLLDKLIQDEAFNSQFDIVITPSKMI